MRKLSSWYLGNLHYKYIREGIKVFLIAAEPLMISAMRLSYRFVARMKSFCNGQEAQHGEGNECCWYVFAVVIQRLWCAPWDQFFVGVLLIANISYAACSRSVAEVWKLQSHLISVSILSSARKEIEGHHIKEPDAQRPFPRFTLKVGPFRGERALQTRTILRKGCWSKSRSRWYSQKGLTLIPDSRSRSKTHEIDTRATAILALALKLTT